MMMPFPGGLEAHPNGTLLFSAALALFYLLMQRRSPSWRRTFAKAGSIVLLAVLSLIVGGPVLLAVALILSAAGDAFLAQDSEKSFLAGLASFLAAHLVYIALFMVVGSGVEILVAQPWRLAFPVAATLVGAVLLQRLLQVVPAPMKLPITVYVVAIAAMMLASATIPVPLVMLGAALFVASDSILAVERFLLAPNSSHRIWTGPAVWVLYYLAQTLLTLGFVL